MGTRLTPMNILRDNIKLEIERLNQLDKGLTRYCKLMAYHNMLYMIEGDSLGDKSLIEQEQELFIDAFMDGFRLQLHHGDLIDEDKAKEIAKEVFERHYNKQEDES